MTYDPTYDRLRGWERVLAPIFPPSQICYHVIFIKPLHHISPQQSMQSNISRVHCHTAYNLPPITILVSKHSSNSQLTLVKSYRLQMYVPKSTVDPTYFDLFKSCFISGYPIWPGSPLFWISKRQSITAHSTADAEVYATNECTKRLTHLQNILRDLNITNILTSLPINMYNDNEATVKWSRNQTTKGLRHIKI